MRTIDQWGCLPLHVDCNRYNVGVAKYFHELYTESINITNDAGEYLLHILQMKENCFNKEYHKEDHKELTQYLLLHDQGAVSTPNFEGDLPLHIACKWHSLCIVISSCMIPTQRPFMY